MLVGMTLTLTLLYLTKGTSGEVWVTALMAGALGFVAKINPPANPEPEDLYDDEEYVPDIDYDLPITDDPEAPSVSEAVIYDEAGPIARVKYNTVEYINQQSWRLLMRSYVAVAEACSPPASFRKVKEALGWHYREQKIFRDMLVGAGLAQVDGAGTLAWTSTKSQRRFWLANADFPVTPPPEQKAPYPTENPSPEVLEHPQNLGTPENTEDL